MAWNNKNDRIANSVNLLAAFAGFAAKPGLISGLKTGVTTHDLLKKMMAEAPVNLRTLSGELTTTARTHFDAMRHDLPDDAEVLYEQMVRAALINADEIARSGLDPAALVTAMLGKMSDREHVARSMQVLFRAVTEPTLDRLLSDKAFVNDIVPALFRELLARQERNEGVLNEILDRFGTLPKALDRLEQAGRDQLEAIATRFEIEGVYDLSEADLRHLLAQKAEEYRSYRAQINALDERVAAIANLKGAAQDAVDRLDFDAVEALLSRVDAVETEIAADTKLARASNALLRGRVGQAFDILTAAADSFASVNALEPAVRRADYQDTLYQHGRHYGSEGIAMAVQMNRDALALPALADRQDLWIGMHISLGNALQEFGKLTTGQRGADLLAEAADAYRKTLDYYSMTVSPEPWRIAQNNLGNTLLQQGRRLSGTDGSDLLEDAVNAYNKALLVVTETDDPLPWAGTQNNLGSAYLGLSERIGEAQKSDLLRAARTAFSGALRVFNEKAFPVEWATAHHNLGSTLASLAMQTEGPEGVDLLQRSVTAYGNALRVRTLADHPVDWGRTQNNLAASLNNLGARAAGTKATDLFAQSAKVYDEILLYYTEEEHPLGWAMAHFNLAGLEVERAKHDTCIDARAHMQAALEHVTATLRVYDPVHMAYDYETAIDLRDRIVTVLDML